MLSAIGQTLKDDIIDEFEVLNINTEYLKRRPEMRTIKVSVKAKVGTLQTSKEFDYDEPSNFEDAIEMDTEKVAFKTYLNERKTNFQDKMRKQMVKDLTDKIAEKMAELGIEL